MSRDVLAEICARKREHVRTRMAETPLTEIEEKIRSAPAPLGFIRALKEKERAGQTGLIAEIKKASPSRGIIRVDFDPAVIARIYQGAGAACLSVLTDAPYFQGRDTYLQAVRQVASLPALRKDFMLEPYQIYESRALHADCILLIMAALEDSQARELYDLSVSLGMDVLVEIHDPEELERALTLKPAMIGVNSRNLKTLGVDLETARTLVSRIPDTVCKVAESGIGSREAVIDLQERGYNAFLVGESLMREPDIGKATRKLLE